MSDAPKPVEEPVAAPAAEETPVAEPVVAEPVETPAETTAAETPAVTEPAAEEAAPAVPAKEVTPVEEGVLGYKGPGLLKSLISQKKFFWFGTEPVETKHLSSYLRGEKPEVANHNAAWASHTGSGLLFFSKKASEKAAPAGLINLSEASDVTADGTSEFYFTTGPHKHSFQAATFADRDNWVSVLKAKIAEAKEIAESVTGSDAYKKSHSTLNKPLLAAVAAPKKSIDVKKEEKAEAKEEKKEEKAEAKEEAKEDKKARKSRSASRKRNSIFGSIGFGKKEDKVEPKEEVAAATPAAAAAETAEATEEPAAAPEPAAEVPAIVEPVTAVPEVEATPAAPVAEETPAPVEAVKPAVVKRNSIFGQLKSQFAPKEKKPVTETAPAVPPKDAEPVSETAPVIPAVEPTEPLAETVAPEETPAEPTTAPATNGDVPAVEAPAAKPEKRKSSIPWLNRKEKATASDEEGEKPKSPFAKLRATVKSKTSPKAAEPASEKPAEPASETEAPAAAEAPAAVDPVISEPVPAVHTSSPQVSAAA